MCPGTAHGIDACAAVLKTKVLMYCVLRDVEAYCVLRDVEPGGSERRCGFVVWADRAHP